MHKVNLFFLAILLSVFILASCGDSDEDFYAPKPRGYFRIDLPDQKYVQYDSLMPFSFEYPVYAKVVLDTTHKDEMNWFNLVFPRFKGTVHFSYKSVSNDLYYYTEDTRTFVYKHVPRANDIITELYNDTMKDVYAMLYFIEGVDAASPLQFYITDSTTHFLRGALYFNHLPNNDSIAPIIERVNEDVMHFVETFQWK